MHIISVKQPDYEQEEEMRIEIDKAVNFLSNMMRSKNPTTDQLSTFRTSLSGRFATSFTDHWFPDRPLRGNAYRCVRINNKKMDKLVAAAGVDAGLSETFLLEAFPAELSVWIDPEEVSYRIGEDGSVGVVYSIHEVNDSEESESLDSLDSCSTVSSDEDLESRYSPVPSSMSHRRGTPLHIIDPTTQRPVVFTSTELRSSPQTVNQAYIHMMS